jgi:predicted acetyltransferase
MEKPCGEGRFTVKINDGFAKWNNNTYAVEYNNGECKVSETTADADVETNERAFMQMILGVYEFEQVAFRGDVQINNNKPILQKAFRRKNLLINDHF